MNNLNENSPKLSKDELLRISNLLKIPLKKHQETSVKAMISLEETGEMHMNLESKVSKNDIILKEEFVRYDNYTYAWHLRDRAHNIDFQPNDFHISTNYGILADKVGAGKTYEIIGLLCHTLVPKDHPKILSSSYYSSIKFMDKEQCIKTNFIIVPHNLVTQWDEALAYTNLNTYTISKKAHIDLLKYADNLFDTNNDVTDEVDDIKPVNCVGYYDVLLISATMLDTFYEKFNNIKWARLIIDEITSIKLPTIYEIKANFIWYITATPSGIRWIRRNYIRDMVIGIHRCIFNKMIIKNDDDYVTSSMNLPSLNQIIIHCDTPAGIRLIREFVPADVLSMLNAGNMRDAVVRLNCNIDTDDNIIKVLTTKLEKDIHNKKIELDYLNRIIPTDRKSHDESIKKINEKISSLETRYNAVKEKIKNFNEETCPICLDNITTPTVMPCCSNVFCLSCLANVRGKCPMCRVDFLMKDLLVIDNNNNKNQINKKLLSKKENLVNIIKKKKNGKFLVFSSYDNTNDNISKLLEEEKITFSKLAGNVAVINKTLERFKTGAIQVLLLNATYYGSGLNLQMATDIIIYHEMDEELETQVIGRAQRMGRSIPLNIYYLLHDDEKSNCISPSLDLNIYSEDDEQLLNIINKPIDCCEETPVVKKRVKKKAVI